MRRELVAATALVLLSTGCVDRFSASSPDPGEFQYSWISVHEVNVEQVTGTDAKLGITVSMPEGCSQFVFRDARVEPGVIVVDLASRRPRDAFCTQAIITRDEQITIDVPEPGEYEVVFLGGLDEPYREVITIE